VARSYMVRLETRDFSDPAFIETLAKGGNLSSDDFVKKFGYLGR
jgi:hypothetical protein